MSAGQSAVNIRELTSSHKFTNILLVLGMFCIINNSSRF